MEKKSSFSTLLFGLALLLFVSATFAMFGPLLTNVPIGPSDHLPNMFQAAFGTAEADSMGTKGIMALFVFQMIIIAGAVSIIYGSITRKFHYILVIIIFAIICLLAFIGLIISFNSISLYEGSGHTVFLNAKLGAGPIAYSVLHIIGLVSTVAGLVLSRLGI